MADKDVNIHVRAKDADAAKRDIDGVAASSENLGKKTEQAGRKSEHAGEKTRTAASGMALLGKAVSSVTGYLAGMVTVAGLFAFFEKWLDWINKIAGAQKELVGSTKSLDQAAKALASQANVMGTEGGMEAARQQILRIAKAGGTTIGVAEGVGVSAHSAFGTSGQLLTPEQEGIAGIVAGFAQRKDVGGGGTNQLLKLLAAMGVENADEAKQAIQQLSTVQQASKAKTFEEFAGGAIKAMVPMLAQGATPGFALSSYASSLDVNPTADLAADQVKQMSAILQDPKILQAMGKESGKSELDIRNMPFDERATMFSNWVSTNATTGAGQKKLYSAGLSAGQLNVASTLFSEKQLDRRAMFGGLAEGATAEGFSVEAEGYAKTTQGQIEAIQSEAEVVAASATPDERIGQAIIGRAEKEWLMMKGRGKTLFRLTEKDEKLERLRTLIREPFVKRMWALPPGKEQAEIGGLLEAESVTGSNPFTAGEIGRIEQLLGAAEEKYSGQLRNVRKVPWAPGMGSGAPPKLGIYRIMPDAPAGDLSDGDPPPAGDLSDGDPPPAGDLSGGQSQVINYNEHHDYSMRFYPVAGNAEDRLIGPPVDMNA